MLVCVRAFVVGAWECMILLLFWYVGEYIVCLLACVWCVFVCVVVESLFNRKFHFQYRLASLTASE
jgi:hypothetical protein